MREMSDDSRTPRVTDKDILGMFRSASDPVLTASEVADELPIGHRGTLNRLHSLREDGDLGGKLISGQSTVWWLEGDAADPNPQHQRQRHIRDV